MRGYLLGLATLPAIALSMVVYWRMVAYLERRHGVTFGVRRHRRLDKIPEYTLRHDIWWERSFGPVFIGGWYREQGMTPTAHFNRWIGLGRADGPCVMAFRSRNLGEVVK